MTVQERIECASGGDVAIFNWASAHMFNWALAQMNGIECAMASDLVCPAYGDSQWSLIGHEAFKVI